MKLTKKNIYKILKEEEKYGLYKKETYSKFANRVKALKIATLKKN